MRSLTFATIAVLAVAALPAQQAPPASDDSSTIRNFLRISTGFCTGGQPRPAHFATLKAQGVKTVLDLRTPGEHRADEERQAIEQAGLKYFNIPVVYTAPSAVRMPKSRVRAVTS